MGRQVVERSGERGSWIKRSLCALAAFATAFVGDNSELFARGSQGHLQSQTLGAKSKGQDPTFDDGSFPIWNREELAWRGSMDGLLHVEPGLRPLDPGTVPGGLEHHGAGTPVFSSAEGFHGGSILQRRDLQGPKKAAPGRSRFQALGASTGVGSGDHGGRRDLRLAISGDLVKPGVAKRMRGQWMKSAKLLQAEHDTYVAQRTTRDRPPPTVDLWELFGGRALCSELAHQYDLEALQPWDLIYGQDFMSASKRSSAFRTLDDFRPLLLMLELKCTHYTLFNKNLNYSSRLEEWEQLQQQDSPLLTFTILLWLADKPTLVASSLWRTQSGQNFGRLDRC